MQDFFPYQWGQWPPHEGIADAATSGLKRLLVHAGMVEALVSVDNHPKASGSSGPCIEDITNCVLSVAEKVDNESLLDDDLLVSVLELAELSSSGRREALAVDAVSLVRGTVEAELAMAVATVATPNAPVPPSPVASVNLGLPASTPSAGNASGEVGDDDVAPQVIHVGPGGELTGGPAEEPEPATEAEVPVATAPPVVPVAPQPKSKAKATPPSPKAAKAVPKAAKAAPKGKGRPAQAKVQPAQQPSLAALWKAPAPAPVAEPVRQRSRSARREARAATRRNAQ